MSDIAFLIGGLGPTLLISRILFLVTRSWDGGVRRIVVVNAVSLLAVSFIAGMGMADGGAFAGLSALVLYAIPQAVWLVVDLFIHRRRQSKAAQST